MTIPLVLVTIDDDTLVLPPEISIKCLFKINRVRAGEAVIHDPIFSVPHFLYLFLTTKIAIFFVISKYFHYFLTDSMTKSTLKIVPRVPSSFISNRFSPKSSAFIFSTA